MRDIRPDDHEFGAADSETPTKPIALPIHAAATAATSSELPPHRRRPVWQIVLGAVLVTIAVIALLIGGYIVYDNQSSEITQLKHQRADLRSDLSTTKGKLKRAQSAVKLLSSDVSAARRKSAKLDKKLRDAQKDAAAQYAAGQASGYAQGSGQTADAYNAGYNDGYNQGYWDGYYAP